MLNGILGAEADWSGALAMQLSGTSFTIQTADTNGAAHNISLNGALSGGGALNKTGAGTLTLNGTNAYSGATTVSAGKLLVNGSLIGNGAVTIANGGALGGNGAISGAVTVQNGSTLAPGNSAGVLTFSNSLMLASGCSNIFEISHSPLTNAVAKIFGALTNGGTLIVTNIGASALAAGDSFKLFNAASYSGVFASVILPPLSGGLTWNKSALNTAGAITVVNNTPPQINGMTLSRTNLVLSGAGGAHGATYCLLASTNIALPLAQWTSVATNQLDAGGGFTLTNPISFGAPQTFYIIQVP